MWVKWYVATPCVVAGWCQVSPVNKVDSRPNGHGRLLVKIVFVSCSLWKELVQENKRGRIG